MLPPFAYFRPQSLEEVSRLLEEHGERARVLAGGTDLLVGMRAGEDTPGVLVDIKGVPELHTLGLTNGTLTIGAAVTVGEVLESRAVAEHFPILVQAATRMASHQVRNRATVVGNLSNASPAADMGAALLVLDAKARIRGPRGERRLALEEFFTGCKQCALGPSEWVVAAEAPKPAPGVRMVFLKHARVRGPDLSTVNCAGLLTPEGSLSLVLGAVAETPVKISGLTARDEEGVIERVRQEIKPIDDVRSSAEYRVDLACVMTRRLLKRLEGNPRGG